MTSTKGGCFARSRAHIIMGLGSARRALRFGKEEFPYYYVIAGRLVYGCSRRLTRLLLPLLPLLLPLTVLTEEADGIVSRNKL